MRIIAHRGLWSTPNEKNSLRAIERAISAGFGIEVDLRDYRGKIVLSHDIPLGGEPTFDKFVDLLQSMMPPDPPVPLAFNVKSDGLCTQLFEYKNVLSGLDYFVFDMSVPDMRSYVDSSISVFTRFSDIEPLPVLLDYTDGVWCDSFSDDGYSLDNYRKFLVQGKRICVVSPELHRRDHVPVWEKIADLCESKDFLLCTDFPEEAAIFFK